MYCKKYDTMKNYCNKTLGNEYVQCFNSSNKHTVDITGKDDSMDTKYPINFDIEIEIEDHNQKLILGKEHSAQLTVKLKNMPHKDIINTFMVFFHSNVIDIIKSEYHKKLEFINKTAVCEFKFIPHKVGKTDVHFEIYQNERLFYCKTANLLTIDKNDSYFNGPNI